MSMLKVSVAPLKVPTRKSTIQTILNQKRNRGFWNFSRFISIKYVLPLVMCVGVGLTGFLVWYISDQNVNTYNDKIMQDYQHTKASEIAARVKPYFQDILPILPTVASMIKAGVSISTLEALMFSNMQTYDMRFIDITASDGYHTGFTRNTGMIMGIQQNQTETQARYSLLNQTTGAFIYQITTYPFQPKDLALYQLALGKNTPIYLGYKIQVFFEGAIYEERILGIAQETCISPGNCIVMKFGLNTKDVSDMIGGIEVSKHGMSFVMESDRTVTADSADASIANRGLKTNEYTLPLVKLAGDSLTDGELQQLLQSGDASDKIMTVQHTFKDYEGDRYVVMYVPMIASLNTGFSIRFVVGIIILEDDFVGFLKDISRKTSLAVSLIVIGMGLIVVVFTFAIVKAINHVMHRMSTISKLEFDIKGAAFRAQQAPKSKLGEFIKSYSGSNPGSATTSSPTSPIIDTPDDPILAIWDAYKHNESKSLLIFDELKDLVRDSVKTEIAVYCASCYTPKGVIKHVLDGNIPMTTGVEPKIMTVMFADIMNFTTLAETYPKKIALATSEFDETVSRIVGAHKGVVGTYNGDNIVAWWNAPDDVESHPFHACTAALSCVAERNAMNARLRAKGFPVDIDFGIGLSFGMMYVGNIGFVDSDSGEVRLHYTTIGDRVNTAARLESATREHNATILVSEQLYEEVKDVPEFFFQHVGNLQLKGKKQDVAAYALTPTPAQVAASRRSGSRLRGASNSSTNSLGATSYLGSSLGTSIDNHPFSASPDLDAHLI